MQLSFKEDPEQEIDCEFMTYMLEAFADSAMVAPAETGLGPEIKMAISEGEQAFSYACKAAEGEEYRAR